MPHAALNRKHLQRLLARRKRKVQVQKVPWATKKFKNSPP